MSSPVRWMSVFIDVPPDSVDPSVAFWAGVSGATLGEAMGDDGEFLPLERDGADACLWIQRLGEGEPSCHPDLYVDDVDASAEHAVGLGAAVTGRFDGLVVLTSPGGLPFCLVRHRGQHRRPVPSGPQDARCLADQVCFDIPPGRFDAECDFWASLTGWEHTDDDPHDEFHRLTRPSGIPYAVLLQRLDDDQPTVAAHLDLACDDRDAVATWHESLGAQVVHRAEGWTVMRDPSGTVYCNTGRRPGDV